MQEAQSRSTYQISWDFHQKSARVGLHLTFVVVLLAALVPLSLQKGFEPLSQLGLTLYGLSLLYFVIGTWGFMAAIRNPKYQWIYFVTQILIVAYLFSHQGYFWIFLMPLASHAVTNLRPATASALCLGLLLFATYCARGNGWSAILGNFLSIGSALCFTAFLSVLLIKVDQARRKAESLSEAITAANAKLREYALNAEQLAVAQERNRMAREIHDGLGHYLTAITVQVEAARALLAAGQPGADSSLEKAEQLSRDALSDVRRSVGQLKTDSPFPSLQEAITRTAENSGLSVQVRIEGMPRPINPSIEHALLRSAQEGLTNIRKHAEAQHTELILNYANPSRVELSISDDGRGCKAANQSGHGLKGLRERIELLGGQVHAANRDDKGFLLRVEVPA